MAVAPALAWLEVDSSMLGTDQSLPFYRLTMVLSPLSTMVITPLSIEMEGSAQDFDVRETRPPNGPKLWVMTGMEFEFQELAHRPGRQLIGLEWPTDGSIQPTVAWPVEEPRLY